MVDDKDIDKVLSMMPRDAVFYWTQPSNKRAFPVEKVAEEAKKQGLVGRMFKNVKEAYKAALADSSDDDFVFVGGSSYVVADLLA